MRGKLRLSWPGPGLNWNVISSEYSKSIEKDGFWSHFTQTYLLFVLIFRDTDVLWAGVSVGEAKRKCPIMDRSLKMFLLFLSLVTCHNTVLWLAGSREHWGRRVMIVIMMRNHWRRLILGMAPRLSAYLCLTCNWCEAVSVRAIIITHHNKMLLFRWRMCSTDNYNYTVFNSIVHIVFNYNFRKMILCYCVKMIHRRIAINLNQHLFVWEQYSSIIFRSNIFLIECIFLQRMTSTRRDACICDIESWSIAKIVMMHDVGRNEDRTNDSAHWYIPQSCAWLDIAVWLPSPPSPTLLAMLRKVKWPKNDPLLTKIDNIFHQKRSDEWSLEYHHQRRQQNK